MRLQYQVCKCVSKEDLYVSCLCYFSPHVCPTGTVHNVNAFKCSVMVWEPPENDGGEILKYRVRLYTGKNYRSTPVSQRRTIHSTTTWAVPDCSWIPTQRPVYAQV